MGTTTSSTARGDPDWVAVDLSRLLDPAYVAALLKASAETPSPTPPDDDDNTILEEMMLSTGDDSSDDVVVVVDTLLNQIAASATLSDADIAKRREIVLQRVASSLQRQTPRPLDISPVVAPSSTATDADRTPKLPFEALLGVKLFCATLDSVDVSTPNVTAAILEALLPLLSRMPPVTRSACSADDLGVLDSISRFLTSTLSSTPDAYASNAISALFGLAVARASLADLLAVLQRILCGRETNLTLCVAPFLAQLAKAHGPVKPTRVRSLSDGGQRPTLPCGDLYAWGRGENGRLGVNSTAKKSLPVQVGAFSTQNLRDLSTFANHALGIDAHDKAFSWGKGDNGRLGHGNTNHQQIPREIAKMSSISVAAVACGLSHSLLLGANGIVYSMGDGNNGRLGHGSNVPLTEPAPIQALDNTTIGYVSCGAYHSVAIEESGAVYTWGKNESGQLGLGHRTECNVPTLVEALSTRQIKMIACGWEHNLAITIQGEAFSWGSGYEASRPVLGHGSCTPEVAPRPIEALATHGIVFVAAGWDHALAIAGNGTLFAWGEGLSGKLGHGDSNNQEFPKAVAAFAEHSVVWVDGGADHSAAITADGQVWTWGGGSEFQLGHGSETYSHTPMTVAALAGKSMRCVRTGDKYTMAMSGDPLDPTLIGTGGRPLIVSAPASIEASVPEDDVHPLVRQYLEVDDLVALSPITVAVVTLQHLDRLALEQSYDTARVDDLATAPFCIDVRPPCFAALVAILRHLCAVLVTNTSTGPLTLFLAHKALRVLGCNLRRLALLGPARRAALGFDDAEFATGQLHEFLLSLIENPVAMADSAVDAVAAQAALAAQVVELLQDGLELFYPTCEAKLALARQSILGETESARLVGDSVLLRLADPALTLQLIPCGPAASPSFRQKSRDLLDLLRMLTLHGGAAQLRFLSSLQAHLLSRCAHDGVAYADVTLDYARMLLDASIQLCLPLLEVPPAEAVSRLHHSLISDICPTLIQTLTMLDLAPRLISQLLSLFHLLDKIAVSVSSKNQFLFSAVHVVADAVCHILRHQIRGGVPCPATDWLTTRLFRHGLERSRAAPRTPRAASTLAVTPDDCRDLYDDLIEDQALGGRLWDWVGTARRSERVGAPQLWLDRAARAVFASVLHHEGLCVEGVLLARLLARGHHARRPPKVPVAIVEAWREAQFVRTQLLFARSAALSADDDAAAGYESVSLPVIAKATFLLGVAVGGAACSDAVFDDDEPGLGQHVALEAVSDDDECAGSEKPDWAKVDYEKAAPRPSRYPPRRRNGWKAIRALVVTLHRWRTLARMTLQSPMKQKLAVPSPYADLRKYYASDDVDVNAIRDALLLQRDRAVERLRGLQHLRRLLAMITLRDVRAKLLLCVPESLCYGSALVGLDGCGLQLASRVQQQALAITRIAVQTLLQISESEDDDEGRYNDTLTLDRACLAVIAQRLERDDHPLIWQSGALPVLQQMFARNRTRLSRALHLPSWNVFLLLSAQLISSDAAPILDAIYAELQRCLDGRDSSHSARRHSTSNHSGGGVGGWTPNDAQILLSSPVTLHADQLGYRLPLLGDGKGHADDYTMAFWLRVAPPSSITNAEQTVCVRLAAAQVFAPKIVLTRYDRKIQAIITTSTGNEILSSNVAVTAYQWLHVAFTLAKRNATLTVTTPDGAMTATRTLQGAARAPAAATSPLFIGKALEGAETIGFDGRICQVTFLRRAVTADEISSIASAGRPAADPVDKTASQLLALLWTIGPAALLRNAVRWMEAFLALLDVGSLDVRIRALRLLRRLLPHVEDDDGDRSESRRRHSLVTFLMDSAASTLWTWPTTASAMTRTEHHRLAVADESIQLLRVLPQAQDAISRALDQVATLFVQLRDTVSATELLEAPALGYALCALSVLGGHLPLLRLGARVRLVTNDVGTICWFRSRAQTARVMLDKRKTPVTYNVKSGTILDEIAAGNACVRFRGQLLKLTLMALAEFPANLDHEEVALERLEAIVVRARLCAMLLKIAHLLVVNAVVDESLLKDHDLLARLLTVSAMPTLLESRLDQPSLETRHQYLWAQLRQLRHHFLHPLPPSSPSPPTPLSSPSATASTLTDEQIAQEAKIDQVASMGFDREFCRLALQNCSWDENSAVEYLLVNLDQLEAQKRVADAAIAVRTSPRVASSTTATTDTADLLRHGLPAIDPALIEDLSGRETGTDVFAERYFADGDRGALSCSIESFLEVDDESNSVTVPVTVGLDDNAPDFGYVDTLRNIKQMDDALTISFARRAVLETLLAPRLAPASLALRSCALHDPHLLIRFLKLVTFRGRLAPAMEKQLLENLKALFGDVEEQEMRRFQDVVLEECLRHMEMAALPEYVSVLWGHRDVTATDVEALTRPLVELATWMFAALVSLPWLSPGLRLVVIERLCRTLRSSNLTLREVVLDILSRFTYTLVDERDDVFAEFAPRYISLLRSTGLERMTDERVTAEEDRLIKSRIVSAKLCILATIDTIQRRLNILQSRARTPRPSTTVAVPPAPLLEEVTTDALEIYWEPVSPGDDLPPSEYAVEMRTTSPGDVTEWTQVYRGAARAYRATSLTSLTSYEIHVVGYHGAARSSPSPPLTVLTHPLLHWDAHHARASGRARIRLSNCALTASFDVGADKWRTLLASRGYTSGLHRWEVVLDRLSKGYIFIGVATVSANPDTYVGGDSHGFGLFVSDRSRYHGRNKIKGGAKYGDQMNVDDVVGVVLDLDKRTLAYTLNGKELGVAFDELPTEHCLFPAISFYHRGDQVSFASAAAARKTNTFLSSPRDRTARLTRRIGAATEFAWTLLESATSKATADHFVDLAYAYWRSWCSDDRRHLSTTSGDVITVDVSRASCARLGFAPNIRVVTTSGFTGRLLGVCPETNRVVVVGDSDTDPDLFSPEQITSPPPNRAMKMAEDGARAAACVWTLAQFAAHSTLCATHLDAVLIRLCNDISDNLSVDPLSLLYDEVADSAARHPDLQDVPSPTLCARFAVLRTLNYYLAHALPYLAISRAGAPVNLGSLIRKKRELMMTKIKATLLSDILHQTTTYTKPSEDPYEDPPDLKQITLNRHLAARDPTGPDALARSLFGQAFAQIDAMHVRDLRRGFVRMLDDGQERTFKVKFVGEGVTDNGGPYRECFNEFVAELFRDDGAVLPLFMPTANAREAQGAHRDRFIPAVTCTRFDLYRFMGKLIGIAVRNHIHLNLRLPTLFWLAMVGQRPTRRHLQEVDALLCQLLQEVEKATEEQFAAEQFDYNFDCVLGDGKTVVELVTGGAQMKLTYANRADWVGLVEHRRLHEADAQIAAVRAGFAAIVPLAAFELFTCDELETLVCGRADFRVSLLQSVTVYESGVGADDAHVQFFWQVLHDMTPEEKSEFCRFVWARTRLPTRADDFITKFKIQAAPSPAPGQYADQQLPQSHTCFFSLALPAYSSPIVLRHKLLYAARNCQTLDRDLKLSDAEIAEIGDI